MMMMIMFSAAGTSWEILFKRIIMNKVFFEDKQVSAVVGLNWT